MSYPAVGTKAPRFSAKDTNGDVKKISDLVGSKGIVIYFYPKEDRKSVV